MNFSVRIEAVAGSHHLTTAADGTPLVVKTARPGGHAERLRREAKVLLAATHPGVVVLVSATDSVDGESTLTTRYVGGGTAAAGLPLDDVVTLARSLTATLADLHDSGLVHGRIEADHILVDPEGEAVLCGLADARLADEPGPGPLASDDVGAVGRLLAWLVEATPGAAAEALRTVAERAMADGANRPSMRSLATMLQTVALAHGRRPSAHRQVPPPRILPARKGRVRRWRLPARSTLVAGGLALAMTTAAAVLVVAYRNAPSPEEGQPAAARTAAGGPGTSADLSCPPVPTGRAADVDGDGCEEPIQVSAGVVEVAGDRWQIGEPTDLAVVADWDCDGAATPVVIRPATGEVWLFPTWAGPTEGVVGHAVGRVRDPVDASAVDADGDGCPELAVIDVNGVEQVLRLASA